MTEKGLGIKGWLAGPSNKSHEKSETTAKPSVAGLDRRRIAVLPLTNISPSPTDAYFAEGLTEEFISAASKIPSIKTISRTSVMGRVRMLDSS